VSVVHIRDDRGNRVEAWSPKRAMQGDETDQRLVQLFGAVTASMRKPVLDAAAGLAVAILVIVAISVFGLNAYGQYFSYAFVLGVFGAMVALQRARRGKVTAVMSRTLLSEHRCPSCAYDLAGLNPQDGLTVCPECLSAWRLPESPLRRSEALPPKDHSAADQRDREGVVRTLRYLGWARAYATIDARGRAVKLVSPIPCARRPLAWSELSPAASRSLKRRLYSINWGWRALGALLYAFPVYNALRAIPLVANWSTTGGAAYAILTLVWPVFLIGMLAVPFTRTGKPIIRIMLKEGRCPSCASRLPPSAEEILDCPVCHAAWQSPEWRLGRDSAGNDLLKGRAETPGEPGRIAERRAQEPAPFARPPDAERARI
jgi:hypothetical protein